jgi:hypothetical protein
MASNFKILIHQNSEHLHLKLLGDFDGSSACELLKAIKDHGRHTQKIFIHTNSLREVHPFGRTVFQQKLQEIMNPEISFVFTGENGNALAP